MPKFIDLTGQRFGRLTVLEYKGKSKWLCECDCGNKTTVYRHNLLGGTTRSCGCLHREVNAIKCKTIDMHRKGHPKGVYYRDITGQRFGRLTAIKPTDKRFLKSVVWECKCDCGNTTYVPITNLLNENTKSCGCLHIEISKNIGKATLTNYLKKDIVEGTFLHTLFNHKINKRNTTGVRGVSINKKGFYRAEIMFQGKRYYLGQYKNLLDAKNARLEAESKLHGDFLEWYNNRKCQ